MIKLVLITPCGMQAGSVLCSSLDSLITNMQAGEEYLLFLPDTPDQIWDRECCRWFTPPSRPSADYVWDVESKSWVNTKSIACIQQDKWEEIKRARELAESGTFEFRGYLIDADKERISGAATYALIARAAGVTYTDVWTLADNSALAVTGDDILEMGMALTAHVSACHAKGRELRNAIYAVDATFESVAQISW